MLALLLASLAAAQSTLVALGDGPVAVPPAAAAMADTVPGGWVAVLADCLEERAPARWSVVNRLADGETARSARKRVGAVGELAPHAVVVGVGAREMADRSVKVQAFRGDLVRLVRELRTGQSTPTVLLLGVVPDPEDDRTERWQTAVAQVAQDDGVTVVDLAVPAEERKHLTAPLTDQGHARVGGLVCDAVLKIETRPADDEAKAASPPR